MDNEISEYILTGRSLNESTFQKYLRRKNVEDGINEEFISFKIAEGLKRYKEEL